MDNTPTAPPRPSTAPTDRRFSSSPSSPSPALPPADATDPTAARPSGNWDWLWPLLVVAAVVLMFLNQRSGVVSVARADDPNVPGPTPTPSATPGPSPSCTPDPIRLNTGEYVATKTDLVLPGPKPIALRRHYGSQSHGGRSAMGGWACQPAGKRVTVKVERKLVQNPYPEDYDPSQPIYLPTNRVTTWDVMFETGEGGQVSFRKTESQPEHEPPPQGTVSLTLERVGAHHLSATLEYHEYANPFPGMPPGDPTSGDTATPVVGRVQIVSPEGDRWDFQFPAAENGPRLMSETDRCGNCLRYEYDSTSPPARPFDRLLKVEAFKTPYQSYGRSIELAYNDDLRIVSATAVNGPGDPGRTVHYEYSEFGFLTKVTYPGTDHAGNPVTRRYEYDTAGRLTAEIDGKGNPVAQNQYAVSGTLMRVSQQTYRGQTATLEYGFDQTLGLKTTTYTDFKGVQSRFYFDDPDNQVRSENDVLNPATGQIETLVTRQEFNASFELTRKIFPRGNSVLYGRNADGDITGVTLRQNAVAGAAPQPGDITVSFAYGPFGMWTSATDANGKTYTRAIDSNTGNVLSITYPATAAGTAVRQFTYNTLGQVLTETAPAPGSGGGTTTTKYDYDGATGYLTSVTEDFGGINAVTSATYDLWGNVASVTDPLGRTTLLEHDALGLLTKVTDPAGNVAELFYDANRKLVCETFRAPGDPGAPGSAGARQRTDYLYNEHRQLVAVRQFRDLALAGDIGAPCDPAAYVATAFAYDPNGNRCRVTDPSGRSVYYDYDEMDRLRCTTDDLGHATASRYDANGNLAAIVDPNGNLTRFEYDLLDRLTAKEYADGSRETYALDNNGNVTGVDLPGPHDVSFAHDDLGRLTARTALDGSGLSTGYSYNLAGSLAAATEAGKSLTWLRDNLGRIIGFTDGDGRASAYTYNKAGERTGETLPTGRAYSREYDGLGRLDKIKDGAGATLADYTHDDLGRRSAIAYANGVATAYAHDLLDRLTAITHTPAAGPNLPFTYQHDAAGRRVQEDGPTATIPGATRTFGYDLVGRLETVTAPTLPQTHLFTYDPAGNRLTKTENSVVTGYVANATNGYSAVGGTTILYDERGNVAFDGRNSYSYDGFGRMTSASNENGWSGYTYDALDRRVEVETWVYPEDPDNQMPEGYIRSHHYDGAEVAVEYRAGPRHSSAWDIVNGPGLDEPVMRTDGVTRYFYHADALGSVVALTDNTGAVAERYGYDAWGQISARDGAGNIIVPGTVTGNLTGFTGREYDPIAGIYYYRARYYHPFLGRFISRDPIGEAGGVNLYAYCGNDPVNFTDPSGFWHSWSTKKGAYSRAWGEKFKERWDRDEKFRDRWMQEEYCEEEHYVSPGYSGEGGGGGSGDPLWQFVDRVADWGREHLSIDLNLNLPAGGGNCGASLSGLYANGSFGPGSFGEGSLTVNASFGQVPQGAMVGGDFAVGYHLLGRVSAAYSKEGGFYVSGGVGYGHGIYLGVGGGGGGYIRKWKKE